jgi:hypothetical protein
LSRVRRIAETPVALLRRLRVAPLRRQATCNGFCGRRLSTPERDARERSARPGVLSIPGIPHTRPDAAALHRAKVCRHGVTRLLPAAQVGPIRPPRAIPLAVPVDVIPPRRHAVAPRRRVFVVEAARAVDARGPRGPPHRRPPGHGVELAVRRLGPPSGARFHAPTAGHAHGAPTASSAHHREGRGLAARLAMTMRAL